MFGKERTSTEKKPDPKVLQQLAQSGEAQKIMSLLQKNDSLEEAAQSASKGDSKALLAMVQQLMSSQEGASLVENLQKKAKDAGIK